VLCLIAGFFIRETVLGPDPKRPIPMALALFAAIVAASLVIEVVRAGAASFHDLAALADAPPRFFPPLHAAALLLEGAALFWITLNASPADRQRGIRVLAIAGAGAATLNVYRAAQIFLRRESTLTALWDVTTRIRINLHFPDVNAAASYFTIPLFIALDRARRPGRWRLAWAAMAIVTAAAVWLTGSRAAILASAAVILLVIVRTALSGSTAPVPRRVAWTAIVAVIIAIAVAGARLPHRFAGPGVSQAVDIRMGMAKAAFGMVAAHPILGVGVGRFYTESSDYMPPDVHKFYAHENAHNNFLQILAELGLVGLGSFLWLLWWSLRTSRAEVRALWKDGEWDGLKVGVLVFLATCLSGHPLLTADVAWVFWMALGLAAGERRAPSRGPAVDMLE
jgi:O-antigen ligase